MTPLSRRAVGLAMLLNVVPAACTHTVKVDPIKVEPIDITMHIYLEADQKLDSFFDYQDKPETGTGETPGAGEESPAPEGGRP